ncbi:MAG: OB-fold nucleic acid binding domain-containing protein, partial [ANME-2 cluster archaeon]|nr:OB-fold nucleic acid binding domain-containing protein [ANME-2 cluster archaeon]
GDSTPSEYSEGSNVGDRVILHGQVVDKRGTFTGDHLILTIDSESTIVKVFVNRNNGASAVNKSVNVADTVEITGILDKYEDEKEIVVEEAEDVKVL